MSEEPKEYRILVVDDNPSIYEDFRTILSPRSAFTQDLQDLSKNLFGEETDPQTDSRPNYPRYRLDYAAHEIEASQKVEQSIKENDPYALVFMDSRMAPGLDGVQATKKIWVTDPNIEVVLCTAYTDYTWQEIIDIIGLSDQFLILKKPFDISAVKQLASTLTHKWECKRDLDLYLDRLESQTHEVSEKARESISNHEKEFLKDPKRMALEDLPDLGQHSNFLSQIAELKALEFSRLENDSAKAHQTINRVNKLMKSLSSLHDLPLPPQKTEPITNIRDLMKSIVDDYQKSFEKEGISFELNQGQGQMSAFVDQQHMNFVIKNLINNSIHAVRRSPKKAISVSLCEDNDKIILRFQDTGGGIPADIREDIMKPYFSTKYPGNSSGLGLPLSKSIIEQYQGKLYLEQTTANGSLFTIELPTQNRP
ncbi:hybrid sensor histidine kinase/response regulator [Pseudobacteriovorax antillogorgiicola]|uniref:histidine kinase n=1 Tax=Pseudobacteriovorax antillogorgiicola TaxID=1513793 RepID=A0A1Y6CLN9_9BACT|nr:hybrid sensor histidine kinase/response regulator [Pseudobacteriovorax antillogorgiicola]TCS47273.1 signal transduction histidine kinase [Pseudobacteriovorax antillogorgiicola]SMF62226.1 Signal transduction histidine kinase [Pseudobacteriovorax antillogorgiicola]